MDNFTGNYAVVMTKKYWNMSNLQHKIKVLVIANGHPAPAIKHFYPFIAAQARALSRHVQLNIIVPIEVLLPIPRHREKLKFSHQFPAKWQVDGYSVNFPKSHRYFPGVNKYIADYLMFLAAFVTIRRNRLEFDLIHAHFAHPSGYIASRLSKIFKKPYLLTVHGSDILENFVPTHIAHRRKHHRDLGLLRAERIICVSQHLKQVLMAQGMCQQKIVVIPNGIDTKLFSPSDNSNSKCDIVFVGNLIELKGIDLLLQAFRQISGSGLNVHLKIIGEGILKRELHSLANQLGISDRVHFLGPIENSVIAKIIPTAKLLCLPSRQEGFGVVLIEALACGVPVVGARTGGIVDIITSDDIGFLFEPGDANDLALKLEWALNKKWDQNVIRQAGLNYCWDRITDQIIEQYRAVLER
jgi:glycosyltransferase involved in cell wall biosynthesis